MHDQLPISGVIERNQISLTVTIETSFEWEVTEVSHDLVDGGKNSNEIVEQENTGDEEMDNHKDRERGLASSSIIVWEVPHHGTEKWAKTEDKGTEVISIHINEECFKHAAHDSHVAE